MEEMVVAKRVSLKVGELETDLSADAREALSDATKLVPR
jgi:hypothetical protein